MSTIIDFKNNKVTLSFNNLKEYLNSLNIEVTKDLIVSLCHKDYIISSDKNKYICKMRYSEERIKKAKQKRLEKKNSKKYKSEEYNISILSNTFENISKNDKLQNISSDIIDVLINTEEKDKNKISAQSINVLNNIDVKTCIQENQTARSSSYLFEDVNKQLYISSDENSDISNNNLIENKEKHIIIDSINNNNILNTNSKKINDGNIISNEILHNNIYNSPIICNNVENKNFHDIDENINISDEILDIYDKLDEKDQLIDILIDENKELETKLKEKDLELKNLSLLIEKYKKGFSQLSLCKKVLYLTIQDIFEKSTLTVNNIVSFNNYINKTLKKETIRLIYKKKIDLDNHIEVTSQELDKMQDLIIKEFNKLQNIIKENID
jgi:hypothetical protein